MTLDDELFKKFRTFLKINGLYKDFMDNFRAQRHSVPSDYSAYQSYGDEWPTLPNYKEIMRGYFNSKNNMFKNFGAMIFTVASFNWVSGRCVPIGFTRKWCTVCLKWSLHCRCYGIETCSDDGLKRLISYWNDHDWIDPYLLSKEERLILKNDFGMMVINGIVIDEI